MTADSPTMAANGQADAPLKSKDFDYSAPPPFTLSDLRKKGSHFDPKCDLFTEAEYNDVVTSATWWWGMVALLAALSVTFGPLVMFKLYFMPYWEWSYLRGGLSTIDRDYGMFNKIHHDIGTHVVHHLFPQIPHYNLTEATAAIKPILGNYYREPEPCKGPFPFHLLEPLVKSFGEDHFVASEGDIVFYQKSHEL
ncbi:unnamed protein product [Closterium sp. NIES-65]|nr:unnamed protein product [Closterium sp. NIES-65]